MHEHSAVTRVERSESSIPLRLDLKAGEWVHVRSRAEILSTLDKNGRLEELPFMPQMLRYCGARFRVHKRVHKVCSFATKPCGNKMSNTVNLEGLRCDGQAYGGCEMECLILWKEAWLKRVDGPGAGALSREETEPAKAEFQKEGSGCSESDIWAGTRSPRSGTGTGEPVYVCQSTQIPYASQPLSLWEMKQYIEDYVSGNVPMSKILSGLLFQLYHRFVVRSGIGLGCASRWAYDVFQWLRGGTPYPWRRGRVPRGTRTPSASLNLRVGELVRVKPYSEILGTLDEEWKNRGMGFHAELSIHCGKTFRVLQRPRKLIDEKTGELMVLKNECIVLEGAACEGRYTDPLNCPRSAHPYWREIWLERVGTCEGGSGVQSR